MTVKFYCDNCGEEMQRVPHDIPVVEWKCKNCGGFYITNNEKYTVEQYLKRGIKRVERFEMEEDDANCIIEGGREYYHCDEYDDMCRLINRLNQLYNENLAKDDLINEFETLIEDEELISKKQIREILQVELNEARRYATPIEKLNIGDDLGYWNGQKQIIKKIGKEIGVKLI